MTVGGPSGLGDPSKMIVLFRERSWNAPFPELRITGVDDWDIEDGTFNYLGRVDGNQHIRIGENILDCCLIGPPEHCCPVN